LDLPPALVAWQMQFAPHALPKAGEGPAKKEKLKMRITQTVSENFR
jgi:hypothetical protein